VRARRPTPRHTFPPSTPNSPPPPPPLSTPSVYLVDGFDTPAATVSLLKGQGRHPVCYFSAGSFEEWRPDAGDFVAADLGKPLSGWPGERWLDVRSPAVRAIMAKVGRGPGGREARRACLPRAACLGPCARAERRGAFTVASTAQVGCGARKGAACIRRLWAGCMGGGRAPVDRGAATKGITAPRRGGPWGSPRGRRARSKPRPRARPPGPLRRRCCCARALCARGRSSARARAPAQLR
jgi:hypothetical protein